MNKFVDDGLILKPRFQLLGAAMGCNPLCLKDAIMCILRGWDTSDIHHPRSKSLADYPMASWPLLKQYYILSSVIHFPGEFKKLMLWTKNNKNLCKTCQNCTTYRLKPYCFQISQCRRYGVGWQNITKEINTLQLATSFATVIHQWKYGGRDETSLTSLEMRVVSNEFHACYLDKTLYWVCHLWPTR